MFSDAMSRLSAAQKSSKGAAAYSRFVNRPLGRPLAALAYARGLSPTQVTLFSAAATFSAIAMIALVRPTWWSSALVAVLLVLGYALDSADGQLARLTGTGSLAGEWLDHFFDATKAATLHAAVLICWFRFFELPLPWLVAPLAFGAVASIFFFGLIATDFLRRVHRAQHPVADETAPAEAWRSSPLYSLAVLPTDYGFLCLTFVLLWVQPAFVAVYSLLAVANVLVLGLAAARWYSSIRRMEAASIASPTPAELPR